MRLGEREVCKAHREFEGQRFIDSGTQKRGKETLPSQVPSERWRIKISSMKMQYMNNVSNNRACGQLLALGFQKAL